jgi:hypothetical protein
LNSSEVGCNPFASSSVCCCCWPSMCATSCVRRNLNCGSINIKKKRRKEEM